MREKLYRFLVNRLPGIRDRYLRFRRRGKGGRLGAWLYLLWLNAGYYLFFCRSLQRPLHTSPEEGEIRLPLSPESALSFRETPEQLAERLEKYDVVSFDVFDTLLFRACSRPVDVNYFTGMTLGYPNLIEIRPRVEQYLREKLQNRGMGREVAFAQIWEEMERETAIRQQDGMAAEWEWEQRLCFANPYMQAVVRLLRNKGKRLAALSDMYLGKDYLQTLLRRCGYGDFDALLVSCDYGVSKGTGELYSRLQKELGSHLSYAHVGDNVQSDYRQANRRGITGILYPNVNRAGEKYRTGDMSSVTGSIYRGLVNAQIHCGLFSFSREYEYGFLYGGLFAAGYCRFIHRYCREREMDRILFLSRDGALLYQAYCRMYPQEASKAAYVYWSRPAAAKITAGSFRQEYLQRFVLQKAQGEYTLEDVFRSMELEDMLPSLCRTLGTVPQTRLTNKTAEDVTHYLIDAYAQVLEHYREQREAGKAYYRPILAGCRRAAAVDIGWAGSGAVMLDEAVNRIWGLHCPVTGILAGTNTGASASPDAFESFFLNGRLVSYLYSQRENRDLWKYHDAAQGHNLYWELLLGSPEGSLKGFFFAETGRPACRFYDPPARAQGIREIHRGSLDFVERLLETERRMGMELPISGRDAYAPMLAVFSGKNRAFRKDWEGWLDEAHIG